MPRYCIFSDFVKKLSKSPNISTCIDARDMQPPPLDASHWDESNELCFVFLRPLDAEISAILQWFDHSYTIPKLASFENFGNFKKICKIDDISASSGHRESKHSSLDSSQWDASNGGGFMSLSSIYAEIFGLLHNFWQSHWKCNISASISARDMKILRLDASHRDESNELCFVFLRPLDAEIWNLGTWF